MHPLWTSGIHNLYQGYGGALLLNILLQVEWNEWISKARGGWGGGGWAGRVCWRGGGGGGGLAHQKS